MHEDERLAGGNAGGAVRVGDTVRRHTGPWTPSVHSLLTHLHDVGFLGAPQPAGVDELGREVLTLLPGDTVGDQIPWPQWVHCDAALVQVAEWLRSYHAAAASYVPPADAIWREGGTWRPGLIIGHNDAAPYNAAWCEDRLVGFFDWDFAAPVTAEWDLAFTAFAWVPLHARHVVEREGFTAFNDRERRLTLFLRTYGWAGPPRDFLSTVQARVSASADGIHRIAGGGDPAYEQMIERGIDTDLRIAASELDDFRAQLTA